MKKTPKKPKSFLDKFNERETKGSVENTAIKSIVDVVSGGVVGPGIAAVGGQYSPLIGIALIIAGHYFGDKSGVLRTTGASSLAFGIAKSHSYQNEPALNSPQKRLKGLGNDLLTTLHINWKKEQNKTINTENTNVMENKEEQPKDFSTKETKESTIEQPSAKSKIQDKNSEPKREHSEETAPMEKDVKEDTDAKTTLQNTPHKALDIDEDNVAQYLF